MNFVKRLVQAIAQLVSGKGSGGAQASGGDLVSDVLTMQAYWFSFLQERLRAVQAGAGHAPGRAADASAMTDVDMLLGQTGRSDLATSPGQVREATLADLETHLRAPVEASDVTSPPLGHVPDATLADLDTHPAWPADETEPDTASQGDDSVPQVAPPAADGPLGDLDAYLASAGQTGDGGSQDWDTLLNLSPET